MYIFLTLILLINPVMAANKTILIKRSRPKKQALLDYKFIFMEQQAAFKANEPSLQSNSGPRRSETLNSLSQPLAIIPEQLIKKTTTSKNKVIDIHDDSNWDSYAVESEENLGVRAWITNLQE